MPRRSASFFPCLILVFTGWACSPDHTATPGPPARVVQDDLGRTVWLTRHPQRLISLAPSVTEMLFALGVGDRVVGVTSYCDYPPEARSRTTIGDTLHPSLERILALRADLVIASRASQLESFARRLGEFGVPLYVVETRALSDVPRSLRRLGLVLGHAQSGESVARRLQQQMSQIQQQVQGKDKPKVLLVIQREPLMVPGTKSYLADLVRQAGGTLIGPDEAREGVIYSLESVIAQRPQIIIVPGEGEQKTQRLPQYHWPKLAQTPAMQAQQVYAVDADLIMRPGPRLVEGLSELARIFHPEVFAR